MMFLPVLAGVVIVVIVRFIVRRLSNGEVG
jgi:hypothetical protein